MPAHDITINGAYTPTGIEAILASEPDVKIFTVSGKPLNKLQKGVNILRYKDGRTRKIVVKQTCVTKERSVTKAGNVKVVDNSAVIHNFCIINNESDMT